MGQFCSICDSGEEPQKAAAFTETTDVHDVTNPPHPSSVLNAPSSSAIVDFNNPHHTASVHGGHILDREGGDGINELNGTADEERMAQYRLEQVELARREAIVTAASQTMVPVGSQGSSAMGGHRITNNQYSNHGGGINNAYYDPIYASAAAQDILRSAAITGGLVFYTDKATQNAWNISMIGTMPQPPNNNQGGGSNTKDAIDMLGRGIWDGVKLGSRGSGLAGCGGEDPEYYLDDLAEAFLEKMVPTKTSLFGGCASIVENLP